MPAIGAVKQIAIRGFCVGRQMFEEYAVAVHNSGLETLQDIVRHLIAVNAPEQLFASLRSAFPGVALRHGSAIAGELIAKLREPHQTIQSCDKVRDHAWTHHDGVVAAEA